MTASAQAVRSVRAISNKFYMFAYCALINTHAQRGDVGGAAKYLKQTVKAGQVSNLVHLIVHLHALFLNGAANCFEVKTKSSGELTWFESPGLKSFLNQGLFCFCSDIRFVFSLFTHLRND